MLLLFRSLGREGLGAAPVEAEVGELAVVKAPWAVAGVDEEAEHGVARGDEIGVGAVLRDVLDAAAGLEMRRMLRSDGRQSPEPVVQLALGGAELCILKQVEAVAGPAAGIIAADDAVRACAVHPQLAAVKHAGNAALGVQESVRDAQGGGVVLVQGSRAVEVVVVDKGDELLRMPVNAVAGQTVVNAADAGIPAEGFAQAAVQGKSELEIGDAVERHRVRVAHAVVRPDGLRGRYMLPGFTEDEEPGKSGLQALQQLQQKSLLGIGIGVDAHARCAGLRHPPERLLDEIAREQRIALVEVGHVVVEPAFAQCRLLGGRGIRI